MTVISDSFLTRLTVTDPANPNSCVADTSTETPQALALLSVFAASVAASIVESPIEISARLLVFITTRAAPAADPLPPKLKFTPPATLTVVALSADSIATVSDVSVEFETLETDF